MSHTVYSKRNRIIPLLGSLFMLLAILASIGVNQIYLHQTHAASAASACQGPPAGFNPAARK